MTGGLQEQVTNGEEWFGVGLEPVSKAVIGSQDVPYIYEDRVSKEDCVEAMVKLYSMSKEDIEEMGRRGREHVKKNHNFAKYGGQWYETIKELIEENGSWDTRKNYNKWELIEI